jgi:ribosomal protein L14E/L6E/L27E
METGSVVKSIAGHDKDRFYLVLRLADGFAWIADGKLRKRDRPKRKNTRHLRETSAVIDVNAVLTDKKLRGLLKPFNDALQIAPAREGGH